MLLLALLQHLLTHAADCQAHIQALRPAARPPQEVLSGLALRIALSCGQTDHMTFLILQCHAQTKPEVNDLRVRRSEADC